MIRAMPIFTVCVLGVILGSVNVFADGPPVNCCLKLRNSRPALKKILNYRIQTKGLCPIKATVFETKSGKKLCSDPKSKWTKRAMQKVDEAKKQPRKQDPLPAVGVSTEGSRSDPMTTTELPLNSLTTIWKSNLEKSKTTINVQKGPKEERSQGDVKGKNKCEG